MWSDGRRCRGGLWRRALRVPMGMSALCPVSREAYECGLGGLQCILGPQMGSACTQAGRPSSPPIAVRTLLEIVANGREHFTEQGLQACFTYSGNMPVAPGLG